MGPIALGDNDTKFLCRHMEFLCRQKWVAWLPMLLFKHGDNKKWQKYIIVVKCERTLRTFYSHWSSFRHCRLKSKKKVTIVNFVVPGAIGAKLSISELHKLSKHIEVQSLSEGIDLSVLFYAKVILCHESIFVFLASDLHIYFTFCWWNSGICST